MAITLPVQQLAGLLNNFAFATFRYTIYFEMWQNQADWLTVTAWGVSVDA